MFKNAASKIAHNTTLSVIGGNKDLKPLQDLITVEKSVLNSLQRLSLDLAKASEALRAWGTGEGDDLGDTLSASTAILAHFSNGLAQYAAHEQSIREHMKSIRSREEALDELKRRRKSVGAKADTAEKRLSKMGSEHKSLQMQTDTLHKLRDEMRALDSEIMSEEARMGDFKRTSTRAFMGLKFGGLQELCSKGTIAGDFGMQVIAEVPEDITQPGLPRNFYGGHGKTEWCAMEAQRHVGEVQFSGALDPSDLASTVAHGDYGPPSGTMMPTTPGYASHDNSMPSSPYPAAQTFNSTQTLATPLNRIQSQPQSWLKEPQSMDDFGVMPNTSSSMGPSSSRLGSGPGLEPSGGRFATFPVKGRDHGDAVPSLGLEGRNDSLDFSSQVELALRSSPSNPSFPSSSLNPNRASGYTGAPTVDESLPIYEPYAASVYKQGPQSPQPVQGNPWDDAVASHTVNNNLMPNPDVKHRHDADTSGDDSRLAYMSSGEDLGQGSSVGGSHVRYGGSASDVDEDTGRRRSDEEVSHNTESPVAEQGEGGYRDDLTPREETRELLTIPSAEANPSTDSLTPSSRSYRVRVPTMEGGSDENALNAAAAREVSREMDSLTFNPPPPPPPLTVPLEIPTPRSPIAPTSNSSPPVQANIPTIVSSFGSNSGGNSPYRTPIDSPQRSPKESPYRPMLTTGQLSNMSVNKGSSTSLASPMPPSTRTISAAAFKRPAPRLPSMDSGNSNTAAIADISPLSFKKRPSVGAPRVAPREPSSLSPRAGNAGSNLPPSSFASPVPSSPVDGVHRRVPSGVPQNTFADEDDQFDYITAYVNNAGGSEEAASPPPPARSASGGYAQGRFATVLNEGSLR